jgi:(R,R)-butanediol dehydrogenase/meso-butanediol dehydrogenase/diacetyl reductase
MKAMVLSAPGEMSLQDVGLPGLSEDRVLIRVTHTGVCGTDAKIFSGAIPVRYPLIMGHEVVGEIVDSNGHESFRPGDRVILDPMVSCGRCFHCLVGQTNLCPNGAVQGRDADGGFGEYIDSPARNVFKLPDSIPSSAAPLIQVASTCVHAQRLATPAAGESAVVIGLGVTGQLHVQLAKARGAKPLIGVTRSRFRRDLSAEFGVDLALDGGPTTVQEVMDATGDRGADLVIECTGSVDSLAKAIQMARPGGRLLLFGITTATEANLPFYQLYFKELAVLNARAAKSEDFPETIRLVKEGSIQLEPLITHPIPFLQLERGIHMVEESTEDRLKVIVDHN